ncbi:MAG: hypothetical protein MUP13_17495 [Thermoanaerobaculales bacterium]|nr:hypothetical protein [Thermoanaerobaculales bacterium]
MATSTIIQFLNPGEAADTSNRQQRETFIAAGAITKGHLVALDTSKTGADKALYVVQAAGVATVGNPNVVGVALSTVIAGDNVDVAVSGYVDSAHVPAAAVAGSPLVGPTITAGQATIEIPGTTSGGVLGVALAADVANFAPIMLFKRF